MNPEDLLKPGSVGVVGVLIYLFVALQKEWLVSGKAYRRACKQILLERKIGDEYKTVLMSSHQLAKEATEAAKGATGVATEAYRDRRETP